MLGLGGTTCLHAFKGHEGLEDEESHRRDGTIGVLRFEANKEDNLRLKILVDYCQVNVFQAI